MKTLLLVIAAIAFAIAAVWFVIVKHPPAALVSVGLVCLALAELTIHVSAK